MSDIPKDKSGTPDSAGTQTTRRDILKTVTIAGTALTVTQWTRPVVQATVVPAHAQATGEPEFPPALGFGSSGTGTFDIVPAP